MKSKHLLLGMLGIAFCAGSASAVPITVSMNKVSTTMSLESKTTGEKVEVGTPTNNVYNCDVAAGDYVLTAYATDGTTVNGTIDLSVSDDNTEFTIITCTAYATNKTDKVGWTRENGDYTLEVKVNSREGASHPMTTGLSTTAGRYTFLAFNGDSYYASFIPSEGHQSEGYVTMYKQGTLTGNINVQGAIPKGKLYTIKFPTDANFELNRKFSHFVDFTQIEPVGTTVEGGMNCYTYKLGLGETFNYRTWKDGGLTQGGYFVMNADESKRPQIGFTNADYDAFDPYQINHSVQSNDGYETGDIFVNINERNYMNMAVGDIFKAHAMRTWELTDNSTNNYFIEPDFHYTVIDENGNPSSGIIEIASKPGSAWVDIKAIGVGTAIVLVTYDAIGLNYYSSSNGTKTPYMGGEYWGAIWPENTAAFVVTVGQTESAVKPEMIINEAYNADNKKLAGKYVDAEHDVFYYLDGESGYTFTFTPKNVASVTIAYPSIGERMATYTGFGSDGVTAIADGSYSLLLKEGRQIVKLTDNAGNSTYQVLTAKKCQREIINASRPGSKIFQPGDQVRIQYSGLRHPANKLAGIYNMSAYVTYNGVPNGSSLILGSGQYTFGSAASAQAVTVDIPEDFDFTSRRSIDMTEGVIQVNGYGDPIGNHRTISHTAGRSPNFTAVAHKTYFGAIPNVSIPVTEVKYFSIKLTGAVEGSDVTISYNGNELTADADGNYSGTYGDYDVVAVKSGYRHYHHTFNIGDDAEGVQTFDIAMVEAPDAWDGTTKTEPEVNGSDTYVIKTPAELAWFAEAVNSGKGKNAILVNDIDMGDYPWTPIGSSTSKSFTNSFTGCDHSINGLYINKPANNQGNYNGLFGSIKGTAAAYAEVTGLTVYGEISANNYVGGIAGNMQYAVIDTCANYASVSGTQRVGGIVGNLQDKGSKVLNCYNIGAISGSGHHAGIVGQLQNVNGVVTNVYNVGSIEENANAAACVGGTTAKSMVTNSYAIRDYSVETGATLVTEDQMASGEIAYKLGNAFGQLIGTDTYPIFGGAKVYYHADTDSYSNSDVETGIDEINSDNIIIIGYYNMQGIKSDKPFQGFNIVRYSDGKTVKIFIK